MDIGVLRLIELVSITLPLSTAFYLLCLNLFFCWFQLSSQIANIYFGSGHSTLITLHRKHRHLRKEPGSSEILCFKWIFTSFLLSLFFNLKPRRGGYSSLFSRCCYKLYSASLYKATRAGRNPE